MLGKLIFNEKAAEKMIEHPNTSMLFAEDDINDPSFKARRRYALKHLQCFLLNYQVPKHVPDEVGDIKAEHMTMEFVEQIVYFFANQARAYYTSNTLLSGPSATGYLR